MTSVARWSVGVFGAVMVHGAVALLVPSLFAHVPPEQETTGSAQLAMTSMDVRQSSAEQAPATPDAAKPAEPSLSPIGAGLISTSDATARAPTARQSREFSSQGATLTAEAPVGFDLAAKAPSAQTLRSERGPGETLDAQTPEQSHAVGAQLDAAPAERAATSAEAIGELLPEAERPKAAATDAESVPIASPPKISAFNSQPAGSNANAARPEVSAVAAFVGQRIALEEAQQRDEVAEVAVARASVTRPSRPVGVAARIGQPNGLSAASLTTNKEAIQSVLPASLPDTSVLPRQEAANAIIETGNTTSGVPTNAPEAVPAVPQQFAALAAAPNADRTQATLAWTGDVAARLSQATVAAAGALTAPQASAEEQDLRDQIAGNLASVRCARLRTEFDPESGELALRGHVMSPDDRAAVMQALTAQLDGALPISNQLQLLGAPQCGVLSSLGGMPIAQSVEQYISPTVIGENLQARTYTYSAGELMRMTLQGADYDGWLYLDYYDSDGMVAHLVPNSVVGPTFVETKATVRFGGDGADDITQGRLQIRIAPPFGQDIAVAMVSSVPLFDPVRPNFEPASDYLADLSERLKKLREDPDYRAEWVYLFIETLPN